MLVYGGEGNSKNPNNLISNMYRALVMYQLQKEKLRAWEKGTTDGRGPFEEPRGLGTQ